MSMMWMQVILEGHNPEKHGEGTGEVRLERERANEGMLMSRLALWATGHQSHCAPQETVWTHIWIVQGTRWGIYSPPLFPYGMLLLRGAIVSEEDSQRKFSNRPTPVLKGRGNHWVWEVHASSRSPEWVEGTRAGHCQCPIHIYKSLHKHDSVAHYAVKIKISKLCLNYV